MQRPPQEVRLPALPSNYPDVLAEIRTHLRAANRSLVPPLTDRDLVGLAVVELFDTVLCADLPPGQIRIEDLLVRARFALGSVLQVDLDFMRRADMLPRLAVPIDRVLDWAWIQFLTWWETIMMPALLNAEDRSWRVDPTTREGQLFVQYRLLQERGVPTADPRKLRNTIAEVYGELDNPKLAIEDSLPAALVLKLLYRGGAWSSDLVMKGRDGRLHIGDRQLRDRLIKLLRLKRQRPQTESDAVEITQVAPPDPSSEAVERERAALINQCMDAAAQDDRDRRDLEMIRAGKESRSARARELGITEGALRRREALLARRAVRHAPPSLRADLVSLQRAASGLARQRQAG